MRFPITPLSGAPVLAPLAKYLVVDGRNAPATSVVRALLGRVYAPLVSPQDRRVVPDLVRVASTGPDDVRLLAVQALGRVGGPEARGFLERVVQDGQRTERAFASLALRELDRRRPFVMEPVRRKPGK